jgi:hypothetical protein
VKCSTGAGGVEEKQDQKDRSLRQLLRERGGGNDFSTDEKKGLAKQDLS